MDLIRTEVDEMDKNAKIYVAGHRGLVGAAIVRNFEKKGYEVNFFETKDFDIKDKKKSKLDSF